MASWEKRGSKPVNSKMLMRGWDGETKGPPEDTGKERHKCLRRCLRAWSPLPWALGVSHDAWPFLKGHRSEWPLVTCFVSLPEIVFCFPRQA